MADPWAVFGQNLSAGLNTGLDALIKKKLLEQELQKQMAFAKYQADLQANAPTQEQKIANWYNQDPEAFTRTMTGIKSAMDPMASQEMALKQRAMQNQDYGQQLDYWKLRYGPQYNQMNTDTTRQRDMQFLMGLPGMTQEKALQYLFRPDLMTQMMQSFMGGGGGMLGPSLPGTGGGVLPRY